jgi:excisionase family DNA binding protein
MSKHRPNSKTINLKPALTFIGEHYLTGWNGQELTANALPAPDVLKKHLALLKQYCAAHGLDYCKYGNVRPVPRGASKRVVKLSNPVVKPVGVEFAPYKHALSRFDFSERVPKEYKDEYAAYQRQNQALNILRDAIGSDVCNAAFVDIQSGTVQPIAPAMAGATTLQFRLLDDVVIYCGNNGHLSVAVQDLQKAITDRPANTYPVNQATIAPTVPAIPAAVEYLTEKQVKALLNISLPTLSRWRKKGNEELPFHKIGRSVRYLRSDVESYTKSTKRKSTSDF